MSDRHPYQPYISEITDLMVRVPVVPDLGLGIPTVNGRPVDWPPEGEMHFRLYDPVVGTLDLSCDTGYVIRSYEFGFPDVREVAYPNSLDDGTYDLTRYIGARAFSLDIVLRPTDTPGAVLPVRKEAQMRDALMRFLHPAVRPVMIFSEHGDDRVRFIRLRGADGPYNVSKPMFNELSVSWKCPRGVIEALDPVCQQINFGPLLQPSYDLAITNPGSAPAHWSVFITGEINNLQFTLDGKEFLHLNYDLQVGQGPVLIDSYTRAVLIGGELSGYRYVADMSTWFVIPPGDHTVTVTHATLPRVGYPWAIWQPDPVTTLWSATLVDATTRLVPPAHLTAIGTPPTPAGDWANLAALKADPTFGDGRYAYGTFAAGEYITLADGSHAWFDTATGPGGTWQPGERPTGNNPPPTGAPPWAWTTRIDPTTGQPSQGEVLFCAFPAWI